MNINSPVSKIIVFLIIAASAFGAEAHAEFWDDEKLTSFIGFPSGYVLCKGEKMINFLGTYSQGISENFTAGTNLLLDVLLIPYIEVKYALIRETKKFPAVAIDLSGLKALSIQKMADKIVEQFSPNSDIENKT